MKSSAGFARLLLTILAMLCVAPSRAAAQSADELAKQTQNPIASPISVPFQGNWDSGLGDRDATGTLLNFQPVVLFAVSQSTNVVLRVIMPLTSQPASGSDGVRINGMSDVLATAFFPPSKSSPSPRLVSTRSISALLVARSSWRSSSAVSGAPETGCGPCHFPPTSLCGILA